MRCHGARRKPAQDWAAVGAGLPARRCARIQAWLRSSRRPDGAGPGRAIDNQDPVEARPSRAGRRGALEPLRLDGELVRHRHPVPPRDGDGPGNVDDDPPITGSPRESTSVSSEAHASDGSRARRGRSSSRTGTRGFAAGRRAGGREARTVGLVHDEFHTCDLLAQRVIENRDLAGGIRRTGSPSWRTARSAASLALLEFGICECA